MLCCVVESPRGIRDRMEYECKLCKCKPFHALGHTKHCLPNHVWLRPARWASKVGPGYLVHSSFVLPVGNKMRTSCFKSPLKKKIELLAIWPSKCCNKDFMLKTENPSLLECSE